MDDVDDREILNRFAVSGDHEVLEELVLRHIGNVRGAIYGMVLSHADADDLTQEVFLKAMSKMDQFNGKSTFATWLYRIAMNTAKDYLRRQKRNPVQCPGSIPEHPGAGASPVDCAVAAELDVDIRGAINALSPPLRSAIVLTAIQGVGIDEAARVEGCLTATMYWRVHQARKLLKKRLARHLEAETPVGCVSAGKSGDVLAAEGNRYE